MKLLLIASLFAALVSGCASTPPPPVNYSIANVGMSKVKHDAELRSINVSYAAQKEQTGRIPAEAVRTPDLWRNALEGAVNEMVIFKDGSSRKINLVVKILKFEPGQPGVDMIANTEARYDIVDRANGDIIYSQTVSSSGTVTFKENLNGIARLIESTNLAVRNNISVFLQGLEAADFNKPMFPSKK